MKTRWGLLSSLLAILLTWQQAAAQNKACAGPSAPGKFRYLWMFDLIDTSPAAIKAMNTALDSWYKQCPEMVRYSHGTALTTDPAALGLPATVAAAIARGTSVMGDIGGWSDWKSLSDIKTCYSRGTSSGSRGSLGVYESSIARLVVPLEGSGLVPLSSSSSCSLASFAPATVRYLLAFTLKDPNSMSKFLGLYSKFVSEVASKPIRYGLGPHVIQNDSAIFGPGTNRTTDGGGWFDFASLADLKAYEAQKLSSHDELRSYLKRLYRIAIPLPATATPGGAQTVTSG